MPRVEFLIFPVKGYLSNWKRIFHIHKESSSFFAFSSVYIVARLFAVVWFILRLFGSFFF